MANSGVTNMFGDYREGKGDKDDKDGKGDTLDLEAEEKTVRKQALQLRTLGMKRYAK